jgi:hypothetical protein
LLDLVASRERPVQRQLGANRVGAGMRVSLQDRGTSLRVSWAPRSRRSRAHELLSTPHEQSNLSLAVPRLGPGALVAELGGRLEAARSVGLIARARERLRRFAEHGACLLALPLSLAEDPPSFPYRAGP